MKVDLLGDADEERAESSLKQETVGVFILVSVHHLLPADLEYSRPSQPICTWASWPASPTLPRLSVKTLHLA